MRSVVWLAVAASVGIACRSPAEERRGYAGVPVVVADTLWRFPSGATVPSPLRTKLEYLGRIDDAGGPYLVTAGFDCTACDAGPTVLLQTVVHEQSDGGDVPGWYAYPGKIRSYHNDSIAMATRLFWGRCLPDRGPGLVQFATDHDSIGRPIRELVRLTEIRGGRLRDDSILVSPPTVAVLRPALRERACREIPPRDGYGGL